MVSCIVSHVFKVAQCSKRTDVDTQGLEITNRPGRTHRGFLGRTVLQGGQYIPRTGIQSRPGSTYKGFSGEASFTGRPVLQRSQYTRRSGETDLPRECTFIRGLHQVLQGVHTGLEY